MTVCVRIAKDVVAEFGNIYDTVEFVKRLGLETEYKRFTGVVAERYDHQAAAEEHETGSGSMFADGVATGEALAGLQASSDADSAAGCRVG